MDKFLEVYNLSEQTTKEGESVINKLPTNKSPRADGFTGEFQETFKKELSLLLLKVFQKIQKKGRLPSTLYEVTFTLIPKSDKNIRKKENYRLISL